MSFSEAMTLYGTNVEQDAASEELRLLSLQMSIMEATPLSEEAEGGGGMMLMDIPDDGIWELQWGFSGAIPVRGDYNGDGTNDLAVYDPTTGDWYIKTVGAGGSVLAWELNWGFSGAIPVEGDYNGDGKADLAVYDTANGKWYIRTLTTVLTNGANWGAATAKPVAGDYDGDGKADLAVYYAASSKWYIRKVSGQVLLWDVVWGSSGMKTVPGDYNGDGSSDLAVYDPTTYKWYIRTRTGQVLLWEMAWGGVGATPVSGAFETNSKSHLAVYYDWSGEYNWFVRRANTNQYQTIYWYKVLGQTGDIAAPADYEGYGLDYLTVYRPDGGNWYILVDRDTNGLSDGWEFRYFNQFGVNPTNDPDSDNLSNLDEHDYGTNPTEDDTDGDTCIDGDEILYGSDPLDAASFLTSIAGSLAYEGRQEGLYAVTASWEGSPIRAVTVTNPVFDLTHLPTLRTYTLVAYRDSNENGIMDSHEAQSSPLGVLVTNQVTGVAIELGDPDADEDDMPDWWEILYFGGSTNAVASEDEDGDGLANHQEYELETDPTDVDTDGDEVSDGLEVTLGMNPLSGFSEHLVLWCPFSEGAGTNISNQAQDDYHGYWVDLSTASWGEGLMGGALEFDGIGYVRIPQSPPLITNAPFTIAALVYLDTAVTSSLPTVLSDMWPTDTSYEGFWMGCEHPANVVGFSLGTGTAGTYLSTSRSVTGCWAQIVATYDGTTARLYLDGQQVAAELAGFTPAFGEDLLMGWCDYPYSSFHWRGWMDDVRVYAVALSSNDVFGLYDGVRDSDRDGMPDWWELLHFDGFTNALAGADADEDGLSNLEEYVYGTDPFALDTDGEGLSDGDEVNVHNTDPLNPDMDEDGLSDWKEVEIGSNPDNPDTDDDGLPDGWEFLHILNILVADANGDPDDDGLANLQEYLRGTNPGNPDTDGDGISDGPSAVGAIFAGPDPNPLVPAPGFLPDWRIDAARTDVLRAYSTVRLADDAWGRPVVAWCGVNGDGRYQLYVMQYFGESSWIAGEWARLDGLWEGLGLSGTSDGMTESTNHVLAFDMTTDSQGWPVVLWCDTLSPNVYLKRWNGASWVDAGGATNTYVLVETNLLDYGRVYLSLALTGDDRPIVSYRRTLTNIVTKVWDGAQWVGISTLAMTSTVEFLSLAVGSDGCPILCHVPNMPQPTVAVAHRWNGSNAWAQLGGQIRTSTNQWVDDPKLLVDSNNTPHVSWMHSEYPRALHVVRRNNANGLWEGYGGSTNGAGLLGTNALLLGAHALWAQTNGNATIAWVQNSSALLAKRWDEAGGTWTAIGSHDGNGINPADNPVEHVCGAAGRGEPIVAYIENVANDLDRCALVVRQYVGDSDGDGLSDRYEIAHGLNPNSSDSDGDGLNDWQEVFQWSTDPLNPDTDGDGLSDGGEVLGRVMGFPTSPFLTDSDGDGIDDNCDWFANSLDGDNDGDGISDDDDPDDDNDGISDLDETATNPLNPDSDCDGIPDNLEGVPDTSPPTITIIEPEDGVTI